MDLETLEIMVEKAFAYADRTCTFAFQGGEPILAGLPFYQKLMELERKYNRKNLSVRNTIQTNGMTIDRAWAEFLADNGFLVGLSLDGPRDIHDLNRMDPGGGGSFARVMKTVDLFNRAKVEYNILSVVNAEVARHADRVYTFFKKNDFRYLQFIPCLDPLHEAPGSHEYSLTPSRYAHFLKTVFDRWYDDFMRDDPISVRFFDNLAGMVLGQQPEVCGMSGECTCQFVIEADGGVYPCDFYVNDTWYLGNVREASFDELRESVTAKVFVEGSRHIDPKCNQCRWWELCRGGCRRNREPFANGRPSLNQYCSSFHDFFDYAEEKIIRVARIVAAQLS